MLAAVFAREGVLELQDRPRPSLEAPDEVLLEVEGCGICGTDLHILDVPQRHPATPGVILGHEYIGRVLEVGPAVEDLGAGDRVAVAPNLNCGRCRFCRAGLTNHCDNFTTLGIFRDGGLARYNAAPERACFRIGPDLPFERAVWIEVLSCVVNSISNIRPLPGETAVVIGAGPVGALHAQLLLAGGVRIIVSDLQERRLELLRELGVSRTVNVSREDLSEVVSRECGLGADILVDAVGSRLNACIELARVGGRISLFGMDSEARPAVAQNQITRKELTIYGSYVGVSTFPRAIAVLESGIIDPSRLISEIAPLRNFPASVEALRRGRHMKVVIRHDD